MRLMWSLGCFVSQNSTVFPDELVPVGSIIAVNLMNPAWGCHPSALGLQPMASSRFLPLMVITQR